MLLDELVKTEELETISFETKARLDRNNIEGWLKTVGGFSNSEGGSMFIGVEDKTNKLIGFDRIEADNERNYFNNQINEHLFPRPSLKISFIKYENNGQELFVIRIDIAQSPIKPVIVKFKGVPSIYMRRDGFTNGATYEEIIYMSIHSQHAQYDRVESDAIYSKAAFTKLSDFYSKHNEGKKLSDKVLISAGFITSNGFLTNGGVLFEDDFKGDETAVMCSLYSGKDKGSERIITVNRFKGNLIDSIEYMMEFVKLRMNHTVVKNPQSHEIIDAYPERALFEGIINAVAHRDYFLDGTQIQLDMFSDRLEISSPGNFYEGGAIKKTYDLSHIISKRRNEVICNILVKCNVMEAAGTGFDKIMSDYEDADLAHKPYIYSDSDHFTLTLPDLSYLNGIQTNDDCGRIEFVPVSNGTDFDEKILYYCYDYARKVLDIANFIGVKDSTYFRDRILDNLVSQGYLTKEKASRAFFYKTNHALVRKA